MRRRETFIFATLALLAAVVGYVGFRRVEDARLRGSLLEARREIGEGRLFSALDRLSELKRRRPDWPGVNYAVGLAEKGRDKPDLAEAAWKEVPVEGEFGVAAAIERSRLAMARGRFTEAESILTEALKKGTEPKAEARRVLIVLLRMEGRNEEIKQLLYAALDDPATPLHQGLEALQELWKIDRDPYPVEAIGGYLREVGGPDPEDCGVRLGLAFLDTKAGKFESAGRLLTSCENQRPKDEGVARARLNWAIASHSPLQALVALEHVHGDQAEADALSAWLARAAGDPVLETKSLKERVRRVPSDLAALERLAEIATIEGRIDEAASYRSIKDRQDGLIVDYKNLLFTEQPSEHAKEIAKLARTLGIAANSTFWTRIDGIEPPAVDDPQVKLPTLIEMSKPGYKRSSRPKDVVSAERVIKFEDDAEKAKLAFLFDNGASASRQLPETMSGGVGLIDYDCDGRLDVFALQGGNFPPSDTQPNGDKLFRNKLDGTFEDVSLLAGISALPGGYSHGVSVGDIDGDGDPDLFITRWRSYLLLENRGDGTFQDATKRYGLEGDRDWPTSSAFADLDGDGDLDLYVCHYLQWDANSPKACADDTGRHFYCTPSDFPPLSDHLFRNDGGKFIDATEESGVLEREGRGLGVVATDVDEDGKIDLYVSNDMSANLLFHNLGGMKFEEIGRESGAATNGAGGTQAGMGIACGDLDDDLLLDLVVTNFFGESSTLHHNLGQGFFADHTGVSGLAALTRNHLGFGLAAADFDNDRRTDLMSANGHVNDGRPKYPWMMPIQLLQGQSGSRFKDAGELAGSSFQLEHLGRGLAVGDLDNDGLIDAVVVTQGEPLIYLHNATKPKGNRFVTFKIEGNDAVGTKVVIRADGRSSTAHRNGGGSYQSANDPRIHFGVGKAKHLEWVEIRRPSGHVDRYENVETGRGYRVLEGAATLEPLKEFERPKPWTCRRNRRRTRVLPGGRSTLAYQRPAGDAWAIGLLNNRSSTLPGARPCPLEFPSLSLRDEISARLWPVPRSALMRFRGSFGDETSTTP